MERDDLDQFYRLLNTLEEGIGYRYLKDCHDGMNWPQRGVYFFFEDGEFRSDGSTPRVVRVGTHAVSKGSRGTLWERLQAYMGTRSGAGGHRGSVFRLRIGQALINPDNLDAARLAPIPPSWGKGSSAPKHVCQKEAHVERAVSEYLGSMPFLFIEADDEPGKDSIRRWIERNAIGLLTCDYARGVDNPSRKWLGNWLTHETVRAYGLWNVRDVRDVGAPYDPSFLSVLSDHVKETTRGYKQ